MAVMGSSGAGKSTLMNILTRRNLQGKILVRLQVQWLLKTRQFLLYLLQILKIANILCLGQFRTEKLTSSTQISTLYQLFKTLPYFKSCHIFQLSQTSFAALLGVTNELRFLGLKIDGKITVNGVEVKEDISKISAYIQQNDVFVGALTVEEHLSFQSKLRMSKETKQRQADRVQEVVRLMGLNKCYKTLIGTPGISKTISGGEMKRLAFASEILTDPPIIFADEPTSGLDSYLATAVVQTLKDLAANGSTILCTIHQPSYDLFQTFDSLTLLSMGRCAYTGDLNGAENFFSEVFISNRVFLSK